MCSGLIRELFCKSFVNANSTSHLVLVIISLIVYCRRVEGDGQKDGVAGWEYGGSRQASGPPKTRPYTLGNYSFEGFAVIHLCLICG